MKGLIEFSLITLLHVRLVGDESAQLLFQTYQT